MRQMLKYAIVAALLILVGLGIGYSYGYVSALNWGVSKAMHLLDIKGVEIDVDVDEKEIAWGIYQYQNQINTCYPAIENATISYDPGN